MSAAVYHFCQRCKHLIKLSSHDDAFKQQHQEIRAVRALLDKQPLPVPSRRPSRRHVWTHECPKCHEPWPLKLLRIGREPLARLQRMTRVLSALLPMDDERRMPGRAGFVNYKKVQQAEARRRNTIANETVRGQKTRNRRKW